MLHLAAQVAVTTSLEDPAQDFAINAGGAVVLLEAVRRLNPQSPVLFASTNKVYGRLFGAGNVKAAGKRCAPVGAAYAHGVSEDTPLDFHSPYGCSKGAADQYVRDYARVFGLRTAVLRMSCIYGPRQFGNEDQGWLAHFALKTLRGEPITIYGPGRQVRDVLFVDDAVAAWLAALERIDAVAGRVFNLGGGPANTVSLLEAIDMLAAIHGAAPVVRLAPARPGDQPWYVSDTRAFAAALGWRPRTAPGEGMRALYAWLAAAVARPAPPAQVVHA